MKVTKRQLKRIIREEYNRILKESGWEMSEDMIFMRDDIYDLASREQGVSLQEIEELFGGIGTDIAYQAEEEGLVFIEGQAGEQVVYAGGSHELSSGPQSTRSYMGR